MKQKSVWEDLGRSKASSRSRKAKKLFEEIEEHRKNPKYVRAVREFIRRTTS